MEQPDQHTALLVMDVQEGTVDMLPGSASVIQPIAQAIQSARNRNIPVIYVVLGFRKGYPEVSANNKSFLALKNGAMNFDNEASSKVHAAVEPKPEEITVIKKRVSAFAGSDLEIILRSLNIKHLILTGIVTGGVVLSTLREAADKDYVITVLSDCCADRDEEVHRVLITKVFPRQANVITAEEWNAA